MAFGRNKSPEARNTGPGYYDGESLEVIRKREEDLRRLSDVVDANRMTDFMGNEIPINNRYAWSKYFVKQFRAENYDIRDNIKTEGARGTPRRLYSQGQLDMLQRAYEIFCDKMISDKIALKARFDLNIGPERAQALAEYLVKKYKRGDIGFGQNDLGVKVGKGNEYDPDIARIIGVYAGNTRLQLPEDNQRIQEVAKIYGNYKLDTPMVAQMSAKKEEARSLLAAQKRNQDNQMATKKKVHEEMMEKNKIPQGEFVGTPKGPDASIRLERLTKAGKIPTIQSIKKALKDNKVDFTNFADGLARILTGTPLNFGNDMGTWLAIIDAQKTDKRFLNNGIADGIPNTALLDEIKKTA